MPDALRRGPLWCPSLDHAIQVSTIIPPCQHAPHAGLDPIPLQRRDGASVPSTLWRTALSYQTHSRNRALAV
jgi:hypothetical protein